MRFVELELVTELGFQNVLSGNEWNVWDDIIFVE